MIQTAAESLTFEEFLETYPEDGGRYELIKGAIVEVRPIGQHEKVAGFSADQITLEIYRLNLSYFIPRTCLVKPDTEKSGYLPDVIVLDEPALAADPYWEKYSTISIGNSAKLVIEVVSTNWQDDYLTKLADYEKLGIPEYWILDYRGLGASRYTGSPKQPTLSIYTWVEGEYQVEQFRGETAIVSAVFPELKLTADQLLQARL
jgi:Uma2 family endonuclease